MTEQGSFAPFEHEIRAALAVPDAQPEFVDKLSTALLQQAARQPVRARRPFYLQLRWAAVWVAIALLVIATLVVGPQRVLAAVRGLLGYIPGVGVVQEGSGLRVLAGPADLEREGIRLQVLEGVADDLRTILVYQADGLSLAAANSQGEAVLTGGVTALLLPDGSIMTETGHEMKGWGTGYQARLIFPALPVGVEQATLVIERLDTMPPGAAPEDWRMALKFKPAPPDFEMLPVYELAAPVMAETSGSPEETTAVMQPGDAPYGIRISLDRAVELEDGYLLQGRITWNGETYSSVSIDPWLPGAAALLDEGGTPIPFESVEPDYTAVPLSEPSSLWAVRTNSRGYPGPWTFTVNNMDVYQAVEDPGAEITIDFGLDPQVGQVWQLNQTVRVAGFSFRVVSAVLRMDERMGNPVLDVTVETGSAITGFSLEDPLNQPKEGQAAGAGGGPYVLEAGQQVTMIPYFEVPTGQRALRITSLSYTLNAIWQVTWDPPASSVETEAPQPEQACLTAETWQQELSNPASLPEELSGRLLVETYIGALMPQMSLVDLDGGDTQVLGIGGWSALSPDGATVAYIESNGPALMLMDTVSGQVRVLPGSTPEDYHPVWSPDGEWIAFVRSNAGIYASRKDGSEMHQVANSSKIRYLAGWMPDNRRLLIISLGPDGSQLQAADVKTGAIQEIFTIDQVKGGFVQVAPDGSRLAYSELVFGTSFYSIFVASTDGSQKRLAVALESGATSGAWSPDGRWLALTVPTQKDGVEVEVAALLQPDTCQVVLLPEVVGRIVSWVAKP